MRYILMVVGIPACIGLGYFVYQDSQSRATKPKKPQAADAVAVHVTRVQKRTISESVEMIGRLESNASVTIRARAAGYLTRIPKKLGDKIKAGDVAVELDNSKHQQQVGRTEATLKVAKAQLKSAQSRQTHSAREVARYESLTEKGGSTLQQLETARSQLEIANAELELEQSRVDEADAGVKQAKLALNETRIVSPITGMIAERLVEVGDLANPNDPLVRIVELSKVRLIASVVEKDYGKIRRGQTVHLQVDAFPGESFTGQVARKAPVIDKETQTALVHVEIDNPGLRLRPGMTARARIILRKRKSAAVVPVASLLSRDNKSMLYVVEGSPPQTRLYEVKTGIRDGELIEVLGGVGPQDRIVTLGSRLVEQGQAVTPVEVPMPATLAERIAGAESTQSGE